MRFDDSAKLIGTSQAVRELREAIARTANSDAKVLVTGESGSGKEVVARSICNLSRRSEQPFTVVHCGGLSETLLESELFGHVKGSFTGAFRDKRGKLEQADRGTVFLDEVGEMSLRMQGLLLRFLETGEIQKVGADQRLSTVNVRTVAATNRHLRDRVNSGHFRDDLFFRLNVLQITVPPLRDRKQDIPALIDHFLDRLAADGRPRLSIADKAVAALAAYSWPGNVRELQNVIERLGVTARTGLIEVHHVPPEIRAAGAGARLDVHQYGDALVDDLYRRIVEEQQSFWTSVYPLFMQREIPKATVRSIVARGLRDARGNYRVVARLFNMGPEDYKKFLNFLRKHECQPSYRDFR